MERQLSMESVGLLNPEYICGSEGKKRNSTDSIDLATVAVKVVPSITVISVLRNDISKIHIDLN